MSDLVRHLTTLRRYPEMLPAVARYYLTPRPAVTVASGLGRLTSFASFSQFWTCYQSAPLAPTFVALCRHFLRAGGVAVDVGANIGFVSVLLGKLTPGGAVYCLEPVRGNRDRLRRNLDANGLSHGRDFGEVVCDRVGEVTFRVSVDQPANCKIDQGAMYPSAQIETLPAVTLDAFCAGHAIPAIDFLKIDTEGAETRVLTGAVGLFRRRAVRCAFVEFGPAQLEDLGSSAAELVAVIRSTGYTIHRLAEKSHHADEPFGPVLSDEQVGRLTGGDLILLPPPGAPVPA